MVKSRRKLTFPKKQDYPYDLELLKKKADAKLYRELTESSASAYFETNFLTRRFFKKRFEMALELIPHFEKEPKILDAGCGIGFFLPTLAQFSRHIWAIDNAQNSLKYAQYMCRKRRIRNINFQRINLKENMPFPAQKFDLIICLSVLEHIKDLRKVTYNFNRVLKKDGVLIAGYPNEDDFIFRLVQYIEKRLFRSKVFHTMHGTKLVHVSRAHQINKIIKQYFSISKTRNINLLPGVTFYIIQKCRPI